MDNVTREIAMAAGCSDSTSGERAGDGTRGAMTSFAQFIRRASERGIPYFHPDDDELSRENDASESH